MALFNVEKVLRVEATTVTVLLSSVDNQEKWCALDWLDNRFFGTEATFDWVPKLDFSKQDLARLNKRFLSLNKDKTCQPQLEVEAKSECGLEFGKSFKYKIPTKREPGDYYACWFGTGQRKTVEEKQVDNTPPPPTPPKKQRTTKASKEIRTIRIVHWVDPNGLRVGYLDAHPDHMAAGQTLDELKDKLRDIFRELESKTIPLPTLRTHEDIPLEKTDK